MSSSVSIPSGASIQIAGFENQRPWRGPPTDRARGNSAIRGGEFSRSDVGRISRSRAASGAIAGAIIKRSWDEDPITSDHEMHSPEIAAELGALKQFEDRYMNAVAHRLGGQEPRNIATTVI